MKHFDLESFEQAANSGKLLMVDFWAEWCGPCRMLGPVVEALDKQFGEKAVIGKVNVDEEPELAQRFGVMSTPLQSPNVRLSHLLCAGLSCQLGAGE